jgi:negative regulator of sigma-B (phosphoserine phosphatase)
VTISVAHLSIPKPGERRNGDAVLFRTDGSGRAMLAVIDGLGHGPLAAEASHAAVQCLEAMTLDVRVIDAMQTLHRSLRETRGAVGTVCIVSEQRMEVCAVGNVALVAMNCSVPLVMSAGVLGRQVPKFRLCEAELRPASRLALLSDGLTTKFRLEELKHLGPTEACAFIMNRFRRGDDDATVLVADWRS